MKEICCNTNVEKQNKENNKNKKNIVIVLLALISIILTIIALNFGKSKYIQGKTITANIFFKSYVIKQNEIITDPIEYTSENVKLTITAVPAEGTHLKVYYKLGETGEWKDYAEEIAKLGGQAGSNDGVGITIKENTIVYAKYAREGTTQYDAYSGPITEKAIENIVVAGIMNNEGNLITYKTLTDAIKACPEMAGETATEIEMLANVSLNELVGEIPADKNIIIDLNGHTIKSASSNQYVLKNSGKLEIRDSGIPPADSILRIPASQIAQTASLEEILELSETTGNSGKITSSAYDTIYNDGLGELKLSSGTIETTYSNGRVIYNASNATYSTETNVSTEVNTETTNEANTSTQAAPAVLVKGATISVNAGNAIAIYNNSTQGKVEINSGIIESTNKVVITNASTGDILITGGRIANDEISTYIENSSQGTLTFYDARISNRAQVYVVNRGIAHIERSYIASAESSIVIDNQGTMEIKESVIEAEGENSTAIRNAGAGNLLVIGNDTIISGKKYGINHDVNNSGKLTIGENDGEIYSTITSKPLIEGGTNGLYKVGGNVYFYDGAIKGNNGANSACNSYTSITPADEAVIKKYIQEPDEKGVISEIALVVNKIYAIYEGEEISGYALTLDKALQKVTSNNKIVLLEDSEEVANSVLESTKTGVTLDLNGNTIALKTYGITNNGGLTITDTSEGETKGSITRTDSSDGNLITNDGGNLTIAGGNIIARTSYASTKAVSSTNGGNVTVTGGEIDGTTAINNDSTGKIEITGGKIGVNSSTGINNTSTGEVKITGGTVNGTSLTAINSSGAGKVSISNATIIGSTGLRVSSSEPVVIENSEFECSNRCIENSGSTIEIKGCTITSSSTQECISNSGIITVIDSEIYAEGRGIVNNRQLKILGNTIIEAKIDGIYMNSTSTLEIGINDGTVDSTITSKPHIEGGTRGIYIDRATVYFYDGVIKGNNGANSTCSSYSSVTPADDTIIKRTVLGPDENGVTSEIAVLFNQVYAIYEGEEIVGYASKLDKALQKVTSNNKIVLLEDSEEVANSVLESTKTGVTLDLNGNTIALKTYGITNNGGLTITDTSEGETKGSITRTDNSAGNLITNDGGNLTIAGGNIIARTGSYTSTKAVSNTNGGNVTVTRGKIDGTTAINNDSTGKIEITGGKIGANSSTGINNTSTGEVKITGGTIGQKENSALYNSGTAINSSGAGKVSISNATIIAYTGLRVSSSEPVVIENSEFECSNRCIENSGSTIEIKGCTITSSSTQECINNSGIVTVTDSQIYAEGRGVYNSKQLNILGNTIIEAKTTGIYMNNVNAIVEIGKNDGTIDSTITSKPSITGGNYGIEVYAGRGKIYFYDGVIKGNNGANSAYSATSVTPADGYEVIRNVLDADENGVISEIAINAITNYAEYKEGSLIGYYATLADAMANVTSGNTIKPLKDMEETTEAILAEGKTAILDLNGKTTTLNNVAITNNGTLTITDSTNTTEEVAGKLTSTNRAVTNNGTLKITGKPEINGTGTTRSTIVNNATVEVNGGTVSSTNYRAIINGDTIKDNTVKLAISGGTITSISSVAIRNMSAGTVNITGGTINSASNAVVNDVEATGTINISGGEINGGRNGGTTPTIINSGNGKIVISGTAKITDNSTKSAVLNSYNSGNGAGIIEIKGGTITSTKGVGVINREKGTVTITGGTILTTYAQTIDNRSSGTINISGDNTEITQTGAKMAVANAGTGTININGGKITSTAANAVRNNNSNGTINITNGEILLSGSTKLDTSETNLDAIANNGILNVSGGTITSNGSAGITLGKNSTTTITGGTIIGKSHGIWCSETEPDSGKATTLTIGTKDGNVSITEPSISATDIGLFVGKATVKFYDGIITGSTDNAIVGGTVSTVEDGCSIIKTNASGKQTAVLGPSAPVITAKKSNSSGATLSSGTWTNTNVYISLTSSNVGAGIKEYQWYENGAWTTRALTTSNNVGTITYTVDRNLTIRYRAVDNNGVISAESTFIVRRDTKLPTITVSPTSATACKTKSVTITTADTGGSGLSSSNSYQYYLSSSSTALSGGTWTNYTNGTAFTIGSGITGTRYLFVKRVSDNAGNISTANGTAQAVSGTTYQRFGSYVFDNTAPTALINTENMYITDGVVTRLDGVNNSNGSHSGSTTTWKDISGNSKNGTITGGTWGANYLDFNGTSSWVNLGVMNSNYQTIEATFSPNVVPTAQTSIIGNWENGGGGIQIEPSGYIRGNFYIGGYYRNITSRVKVVAGNKYHAAITYNGSAVVLYVNGVEQGRVSISGTIGVPAESTVMVLGTNPSESKATGGYFDGKIYTAAVYNKALTPAQVLTNAQAGKALAGGPTNASSITYTIRFNETVSGFTTEDVTITNGTKGAFTPVTTGKVFTVVATTTANQNNTQTIALAANGCTDTAGNGIAATSKTVVIDRVAPTVTLSTNGGTYNITPGNTTVSVSTTPTVADTGSGVAGLGYAWSTSNSTEPSSWTELTSGTAITNALSGGKNYLWTNVIDNAGNRATSIKTSSVFTVNYQVVFNNNNGTGAPSAQSKVHGTTLVLSTTKPTRAGYTFKEWNTKADGTGTAYASGANYTANSAVILYAQWTPNKVSIRFHLNGGMLAAKHGASVGVSGNYVTNNGSNVIHTINYGASLSSNGLADWDNSYMMNVIKSGYTITSGQEYNTKADGTGTTYNDSTAYAASDFADLSTGNKTIDLYFKWVPCNYTLTYDVASGTAASGNPTTYNITSSNITLKSPTRTGYTFNGWTEQITGLTWYEGFVNLKTGVLEESTSHPDSWHTDFIYLEAGKTYTLSGYGDYTTSGIRWRVYGTDGTYKTNGSSSATYTPTENCYVRIVYFETSTSAQRNGTIITSGTKDKTEVISKGTTGNRKYTANWTANNYTITYNYNGTKNYVEPNAETITCTGFTGSQNKCFSLGKIYVDDLTANDKLTISCDVSYSGLTAAEGQTASAVGQASGDVTGWTTPLGGGVRQSWLGTGTTSYSYTATMNADKITNNYFNFAIRTDYYASGTIKISNIKVVRTTTESKSLPYGSPLGTLPAPSETGYTLNGWYTAKTGGTKIDSTTTVTGNKTYYAHWSGNYDEFTPSGGHVRGYLTLADAVSSANSGNTIKVMKYVEETTGVVVDEGKMLTIDMNGINTTLNEVANEKFVFSQNTSGEMVALNNKGNLTIKGSGTLRTTSNKIKVFIGNSGTLNIEDSCCIANIGGNENPFAIVSTNLFNMKGTGTISASYCAAYNDGGVANIYNGKFISNNHGFSNGGVLNLGQNENPINVNTTTPEISVCLTIESSGSLNFYDGIVKGTIWVMGKASYTPSAEDLQAITSIKTPNGYIINFKSVSTNSIGREYTLYKKAMFDTGKVVNQKMKTLAGDTNPSYSADNTSITKISYSSTIDDKYKTDANKVSASNSAIPIYMWFDSGTIYWWSEDSNPYCNPDSSYMFNQLTKLIDFDSTKFNTSQVTNMQGMFRACVELKSLELSSFDTSNVVNMEDMFNNCINMKSLNISNFDTSNVLYMRRMFSYMVHIESLDLLNFDTSNVTNMIEMFKSCYLLKTIYVGSNWTTSQVTDSSDMFSGCTNIQGGAGTTYNYSSYEDKTYARIDGGTSNPGYFTAVPTKTAMLSKATSLTNVSSEKSAISGNLNNESVTNNIVENLNENTENKTQTNTQTIEQTEQTQATKTTEKAEQSKIIAQVNEKNCSTIAEAIELANSGETVKILDNISLTEEILIDESKNINLDLNGKNITSTVAKTITNKGTLNIIGTGIIKNETNNCTVINNLGKLTIEKGIITTAQNGAKCINNEGNLTILGGKIVTEGVGAIGINNNKTANVSNCIIETTGFGNKGVYNNSELVIENTKIVVSGDDSKGIYNSEKSVKCNLVKSEIFLEAEVIENYDQIKNTNEFKEELEKIKPSYGVFNNSKTEVILESITLKVERLKGVGIQNNAEGAIVLGKTVDNTKSEQNKDEVTIYAIKENTTAIVNTNTQKGKIKFYKGTINTLKSVKTVITEVLEGYEIAESQENGVFKTVLVKKEE